MSFTERAAHAPSPIHFSAAHALAHVPSLNSMNFSNFGSFVPCCFSLGPAWLVSRGLSPCPPGFTYVASPGACRRMNKTDKKREQGATAALARTAKFKLSYVFDENWEGSPFRKSRFVNGLFSRCIFLFSVLLSFVEYSPVVVCANWKRDVINLCINLCVSFWLHSWTLCAGQTIVQLLTGRFVIVSHQL